MIVYLRIITIKLLYWLWLTGWAKK